MTFVSSVPSTWLLAVHSVAIDYSLARTLRAAGTAQQHATSDGSHRGRSTVADTDCANHQQTATASLELNFVVTGAVLYQSGTMQG